jgi:restriction system protein
MNIPAYDEMMNPLLEALHMLGGTGTIDEINSKVIEIMEIPDDIAETPHDNKGYQTEIGYRLAWTRTYLKKYGVISNPEKGIWALTEYKEKPAKVDPVKVKKLVKNTFPKDSKGKDKKEFTDLADETEETPKWVDELNDILLSISPNNLRGLPKGF